jgi:hypothetical protein
MKCEDVDEGEEKTFPRENCLALWLLLTPPNSQRPILFSITSDMLF